MSITHSLGPHCLYLPTTVSDYLLPVSLVPSYPQTLYTTHNVESQIPNRTQLLCLQVGILPGFLWYRSNHYRSTSRESPGSVRILLQLDRTRSEQCSIQSSTCAYNWRMLVAHISLSWWAVSNMTKRTTNDKSESSLSKFHLIKTYHIDPRPWRCIKTSIRTLPKDKKHSNQCNEERSPKDPHDRWTSSLISGYFKPPDRRIKHGVSYNAEDKCMQCKGKVIGLDCGSLEKRVTSCILFTDERRI